jgi:hypothetical protein
MKNSKTQNLPKKLHVEVFAKKISQSIKLLIHPLFPGHTLKRLQRKTSGSLHIVEKSPTEFSFIKESMEIGTENSSLTNSAFWKLLAFPKYPKERVTEKRKYTFPVMDFIPGYSLPLQYGGTSLHTAENFVPFQDRLHGEKSKMYEFPKLFPKDTEWQY